MPMCQRGTYAIAACMCAALLPASVYGQAAAPAYPAKVVRVIVPFPPGSGVDIVTRFLGDDVERAVQAREIDLAYGSRLRGLSGVVSEAIGEETMTVLLSRRLRRPLDAG